MIQRLPKVFSVPVSILKVDAWFGFMGAFARVLSAYGGFERFKIRLSGGIYWILYFIENFCA
jgi:hypothetical protein